jgi:ribonuclease HI
MMSDVNEEATALLRGLEFLEKIGCSSAYVESDSLELIKGCNGDIEIWSPYTAVLADCFQKPSLMDMVVFQHYSRDANVVAHNLAKVTYESRNSFIWDGSPPDFIVSDAIRDVTLLSSE